MTIQIHNTASNYHTISWSFDEFSVTIISRNVTISEVILGF